jgi:hypothetical protein
MESLIPIHSRLFFILCSVAAACSSASESLCSADEQVLFSCVTDHASKVLSLCASPDLTARTGTLYYRFGTPHDIALEYPKKRGGKADSFRYAHYSRFQTERSEVTFSIGKYSYAVVDYYDGSEKIAYHRGVHVAAGDEPRESVFACKSQVTSNLHRLEGKVPCDEASALAQCN